MKTRSLFRKLAGIWILVAAAPQAGLAFELGALRLEPGTSPALARGSIAVRQAQEPSEITAWVVSADGYRAAGLNPRHAMTDIRIASPRGDGGEPQLTLESVPLLQGGYELLLFAHGGGQSRVVRYRIDAAALGRDIAGVAMGRQQLGRSEGRVSSGAGAALSLGEAQAALARAGSAAPATSAGSTAASVAVAASASPPASAQTQAQSPAAQGGQRRETDGAAKAVSLDVIHGAEQVRSAIEQWRAAWSRRDVAGYLAAYAPQYSGQPGGGGRVEWEAERRARIQARQRIQVEVQRVRLSQGQGVLLARFDQTYRADGRTVIRTRKQLSFQPDALGRWLIVGEAELR
jgi:hypothetical protein